MSDALTSGLSFDEREDSRLHQLSRLRDKLDSEIGQIVYRAVRFKEIDEKRVIEILEIIDKEIPGCGSNYGVGWLDQSRISLLGAVAYCERYEKK